MCYVYTNLQMWAAEESNTRRYVCIPVAVASMLLKETVRAFRRTSSPPVSNSLTHREILPAFSSTDSLSLIAPTEIWCGWHVSWFGFYNKDNSFRPMGIFFKICPALWLNFGECSISPWFDMLLWKKNNTVVELCSLKQVLPLVNGRPFCVLQ